MKKLLASFILGLSLLSAGTLSLAQAPAPADTIAAPVADAAAPAPVAAPAAEAPAPAAEPVAAAEAAPTAPAPKLDSGDTAWMLTSTMLVILMVIPGLALFYGGLVRSKNMLSVLVQVFVIFALITVLWAVYGYSLTFAGEGQFFGGFDKIFLKGIAPDTLSGLLPTIPEYVFVAFQSTFAAITVALIVGSFAERIKFAAVLIFAVLWFTFSYIPMAHMVWGGGLLGKDGALDFAGGTVVHINAGVAGLIACLVLGKRKGFPTTPMAPHNLGYTLMGAAMLWVGWFGFNAGSAAAANGTAGMAMLVAIARTMAALTERCMAESPDSI